MGSAEAVVAALVDPSSLSGAVAAAGVAGESSITQTALLAVIVLLVAVLIALLAMVVVLRRRARDARAPEPAAPAPRLATPRPRPRQSPSGMRVARGGGGAAGGLAVATSAMVCPTCRSEYDGHMYCLRDARRLVPAEEMLGGQRSAGLYCATCRRAFEPGLRKCPHDGADLMPASLYWASRPKRARAKTEPLGVIGRICPVCRGRYDLAARFCGVDGAELVVIN
jgi:hypothetical protein